MGHNLWIEKLIEQRLIGELAASYKGFTHVLCFRKRQAGEQAGSEGALDDTNIIVRHEQTFKVQEMGK